MNVLCIPICATLQKQMPETAIRPILRMFYANLCLSLCLFISHADGFSTPQFCDDYFSAIVVHGC